MLHCTFFSIVLFFSTILYTQILYPKSSPLGLEIEKLGKAELGIHKKVIEAAKKFITRLTTG